MAAAAVRQQWERTLAVRERQVADEVRVAVLALEYQTRRVARLRDVAHGGQVVLSEATRLLVEEALPEGVTLRDLGRHRLKDLASPEHVFQLAIAGLRADFPPLLSLDVLPNNLPRQLSSFVGRTRELAEVGALLRRTPLLTLTGSGGAGKTRLALQVAAEMIGGFPDGVWLVELSALADPALVTQTAAMAVGVHEEHRPLIDTLVDHLKPRAMLLLLDNCEHFLAASAALVGRILRDCPAVRILATSQEALGVAGETVYRVPSLSLPDPGHLPPVDRLTEFESIRLFVERAAAGRPGFTVTAANARAVG